MRSHARRRSGGRFGVSESVRGGIGEVEGLHGEERGDRDWVIDCCQGGGG